LGLALVGVLVAAASGCGSDSNKEAKSPLKDVAGVPHDDQSRCDFRGRGDREVSEATGPGAHRPNIRRVFGVTGQGDDRRRVLLCREVDTNLDGAKDIVRTFTDRGEPLSELTDSNYDGKIDTWITFARGRVSKMQIDNTGHGEPDETRFYVAGKLSRAQRDTNGDGKPDVWEIYEEGKLQPSAWISTSMVTSTAGIVTRSLCARSRKKSARTSKPSRKNNRRRSKKSRRPSLPLTPVLLMRA